MKYLNPSEIFKTSLAFYFYKNMPRDTRTHLLTAAGAPTSISTAECLKNVPDEVNAQHTTNVPHKLRIHHLNTQPTLTSRKVMSPRLKLREKVSTVQWISLCISTRHGKEYLINSIVYDA